jgi:hypothetical protein
MTVAKERTAPRTAGDPKLAAHRKAVGKPIARVVADLQEVLGQELTAIVAGVRDVKAVGRWARGEHRPQPKAETALRDAYQIVQVLLAHEEVETVRAWMRGMNHLLDNRAPALVIREAPDQVAAAADALIEYA